MIRFKKHDDTIAFVSYTSEDEYNEFCWAVGCLIDHNKLCAEMGISTFFTPVADRITVAMNLMIKHIVETKERYEIWQYRVDGPKYLQAEAKTIKKHKIICVFK